MAARIKLKKTIISTCEHAAKLNASKVLFLHNALSSKWRNSFCSFVIVICKYGVRKTGTLVQTLNFFSIILDFRKINFLWPQSCCHLRLQLAPENTIMSFEKAVEARGRGLETDVTIRYFQFFYLIHQLFFLEGVGVLIIAHLEKSTRNFPFKKQTFCKLEKNSKCIIHPVLLLNSDCRLRMIQNHSNVSMNAPS